LSQWVGVQSTRNRVTRPPLAHWMNEQVIYHRIPGSCLPTIVGVVRAQKLPGQPPLAVIADSPNLVTSKVTPIMDSPDFEPETPSSCEVTPPPLKRQRAQRQRPERALCDGQVDTGPRRKRGIIRSQSPASVQVSQPSASIKKSSQEQAKSRAGRSTRQKVGSRSQRDQCVSTVEERLLPLDDGYYRMVVAQGSKKACELRKGVEYESFHCIDVRIPPLSHPVAERVPDGSTLLVYIISAARNAVCLSLDGVELDVGAGDLFKVQAGSEYCVRNKSKGTHVCMKLVLVTVMSVTDLRTDK